MKRFSLVDGELVADPAGDLVRFEDLEELVASASLIAGDRDRFSRALGRIAGVPVSMPLSEAVGVARSALDRSEP